MRSWNQASVTWVFFSFIIILQLRRSIELKFSQVCYKMYFVPILRYTKWEDWSVTITNSVHCLSIHNVLLCWNTGCFTNVFGNFHRSSISPEQCIYKINPYKLDFHLRKKVSERWGSLERVITKGLCCQVVKFPVYPSVSVVLGKFHKMETYFCLHWFCHSWNINN